MYVIVIYKVTCEDIDLFYHVGVEVDFDERYFLLLVTDSFAEAVNRAMGKLFEYVLMKGNARIAIRELKLKPEDFI